MQSVVAHIQANDVFNPAVILLEERNRQKNINPNARWYVSISEAYRIMHEVDNAQSEGLISGDVQNF